MGKGEKKWRMGSAKPIFEFRVPILPVARRGADMLILMVMSARRH
jgi:hypothetical protein